MITGRRVTNPPTRDHTPVRVGSSWPTFGTNGQNNRRPNSTIAAGSTRSAKASATVMPAAPAKPSERANGSTARPSASSARITVPPLARIAGAADPSARRIASCRSSTCRSSSR